MSFFVCIHQWNCYSDQDTKHFQHPQKLPRALFISLCSSNIRYLLFSLILDLFAFSKILYAWNNVVCNLLGLASFSLIILRFIHVVAVAIGHCFICWVLFLWTILYPFTVGLFPSFGPLGMKVLWTLLNESLCGFIFSFFLSKYLGVNWRDCTCAGSFLRNSKSFPKWLSHSHQ